MVLRRDVRLVNEMYHIAVEADDDDDDEIVSQPPLSLVPAKLSCWLSVHQSDDAIEAGVVGQSPEGFIDVCYIHNVGIGVHPLRREQMVKAAITRKGRDY